MYSTSGIVLNHVKYSETSVIVHIYTELFGRQSYMVNGVRRARSKGKAVLLQPLTLLDLEVTHHEKKEIHRIVDYQVSQPFVSIPFDQVKRAMTFFITEVLIKVLNDEQPNPDLYHFLFHSIELLDEGVDGLANYHLFFLFHLSRYLGFGPDKPALTNNHFFDLKDGIFRSVEPDHPYFISKQGVKYWMELYLLDLEHLDKLHMSASQRRDLLHTLSLYYELHIHNFGPLKSLDVLHVLFE